MRIKDNANCDYVWRTLMRLANLAGRLVIVVDDQALQAVDVEKASGGRFSCDPQAIFEVWDDFRGWASTARLDDKLTFRLEDLAAPVPAPAQVFAIGLNYGDHANESNLPIPEDFPPVFTKFRTALSGPVSTVCLPDGGHTDWEVELVVVMGRRAKAIGAEGAWSYVAGLTVGQDISERISQLSGPAPQFSLGKSFAGFAPTGPWVVTSDEFSDPAELELGCAIDGEKVQNGNTRDLLFSVPTLIAGLAAVTTLLPGDLIFTGTPSGVGLGQQPQRFIQPGEELVSWIEGIGELRQTFVTASTR
jgi:2,4-didehydro-3-deoxy-L-rhamnonate hydrolase